MGHKLMVNIKKSRGQLLVNKCITFNDLKIASILKNLGIMLILCNWASPFFDK